MIVMNDNFEKIGDQLQKALKEFYDGIEVPEPSGWEKTHAQMQKQRRKKKGFEVQKYLKHLLLLL